MNILHFGDTKSKQYIINLFNFKLSWAKELHKNESMKFIEKALFKNAEKL